MNPEPAAPSRVFFVGPDRLEATLPGLLEATGFLDKLTHRHRLGIKLHFGEEGNRNYLRPEWVRAAVTTVARRVVDVVLLETTTLYRGSRARGSTHVALAHRHGFTLANVMAPVQIVDGEQGEDCYEVPVNRNYVAQAKLGRKLRYVPQLLNLAHFKGHFVTGFGGVLKNLAMGLAAKSGKLDMHSLSKPVVNEAKCASCGDCVEYCPHQAIDFIKEVARIGRSCTGCAGCIAVCRPGAISIQWNEAAENVGMKVVEYAWAVLKDRLALHVNFVLKVTPNCDCMGITEDPLLPDVGVFASFDPVACEQAAWDATQVALKKQYPHLEPERQIAYAEELGLGTRQYEIVKID
jgi:uncharacterized Fe-S center protein